MKSQRLLRISHLGIMAATMHPVHVTRITRSVTAMVEIYQERRTLMRRIQGYKISAYSSCSWEKRHIPSWYCSKVSCLSLHAEEENQLLTNRT